MAYRISRTDLSTGRIDADFSEDEWQAARKAFLALMASTVGPLAAYCPTSMRASIHPMRPDYETEGTHYGRFAGGYKFEIVANVG